MTGLLVASRDPQRRQLLQAAAGLGLGHCLGAVRAEPATVRQVERSDLVKAFDAQRQLGYRMDRIAHAARLQAGVLLHLAANVATPAAGSGSAGLRLRVDHRDYLAAYQAVTRLAVDALPSFIRAAAEVGEDLLVEHRLDAVVDGPPPPGLRRALSVKAGWPPGPTSAPSYRFLDTSSDPHVETVREAIGTWRLLDFGDVVVQDQIEGVSGRATSGLLGAVFSVVGQARVLQSRYAVATDGLMVVRTAVRSGITVTQSATVTPDGRIRPGLPPERPDLEAIEDRLTSVTLPTRYQPIDRTPMSRAPSR